MAVEGIEGTDVPTTTEQVPLVLVVDDDPIMRNLIVQAVAKEGYRVMQADNGAECLTLFREHAPDLVLLDAVMPVMDGFACCSQLQNITPTTALTNEHVVEFVTPDSTEESEDEYEFQEKTPVLMITGLDDDESVDRAFDAGASDYVTKPIHWKVLRRRVNRIIQQSHLHKNLEKANAELNRLASTDSLTQLANRKRFDEYFTQQWNLMHRLDKEISLILCDIDFFKQFNDTYGHQGGDRCLRVVAAAIAKQVHRPSDLVARYGGEEFAVILPNCGAKDAADIALKICQRIESLEMEHKGSEVSDFVTLSIGVAGCLPAMGQDYQDLIGLADRGLYSAKEGGKNGVYLAYDEHEPCLQISSG
ncbi:MAG: diguanylate cyclase [Pseudomonadales bacterium]|nr:diguanylate cyclase [Pseudomonadales bacterium]